MTNHDDKPQSIKFVVYFYLTLAILITASLYFCNLSNTAEVKQIVSPTPTIAYMDEIDIPNDTCDAIDEPIEQIEVLAFAAEAPEINIAVSEEDAIYIAKTIWGEARGCTKIEQAAVAWCILNRVDNDNEYLPDTVEGVVTQENQFHGYSKDFPVDDDIYDLAVDVLERWGREKIGEGNVGRVLPKEYLYFYGDGKHNHFTIDWKDKSTWDWSLENPYE